MRLIDADLLKRQMESVCMGIMAGTDSYGAPLKTIDNAPTVDAEPVKHGHWIAHDMSIKDVPTEACSECGEWSYGYNEPYCPNCGCKMDEVEE